MNLTTTKILFILTVVLSFLVGLLSYLVGTNEQTEIKYYLYATIVTGATIGFFGPKKSFWVWPFAYYLGLAIFLKTDAIIHPNPEKSAWFAAGLIIAFIISVPLSLLASFAGAFVVNSLFNKFSMEGKKKYFFAIIILIFVYMLATLFGFLSFARYFDSDWPEKTDFICREHSFFREIENTERLKYCHGYWITNVCANADKNGCKLCFHRCFGIVTSTKP